ncbi:hypothetical protein [Allochromatium vinosum]|uniref:hypothetical protein n=1 Tax=Allochromatium vinosum TaxID=1049 RepID=UPI0019031029|nr:hypothetical protein [Allochromatium vinosum]MBK1653362.1 hypothetical protein [Allochromatium vinosum]
MSTHQDTLIGRRVEAHREELRYAAFNLARTVGLAQHLVTEIEAGEPGPLNNTGVLYGLLETIRLAQMALHGTLSYVVGEGKGGAEQ